MPHGPLTHQVALGISQMLSSGQMNSGEVICFYDPHRGNPRFEGPCRAAHLYAFMGDVASHGTNLSQCDLMIVERRSSDHKIMDVKLIIEIEEGSGGSSPKKVLGDVLNMWMANNVHAGDELYQLNNTALWIVVCEASKGSKNKQYDHLASRLELIRSSVQRTLGTELKISKTVLVRCQKAHIVDTVVDKVRAEYPQWFNSRG